MVRRGGNQYYDDDDFDDGYDDDDYGDGDEEDDGWGAKQTPAGKQTAQAGKGAAAAAGGARTPAAASVKPEPAAVAKQQQTKFPPAPSPSTTTPAKSAQAPPAPFTFSTPSPDDAVLAAQRGEASGAAARPAPSTSTPQPQRIHLPQSKSVMGKATPQPEASTSKAAAAAATPGTPATGVTAGMGGLSLGTPAAPAVPSTEAASAAMAGRKRVSDYVMEPDLARACEEAAAAEAGGGAKPGLHLVVLGHVDAGKSTLMGRLLADLGVVSQRDVQRSAKEAAAVGKASFAWAFLLDERPEERARGVTVDVATTRFTTPRYNVTLLDAPGHRDFVPNMIGGAAQADAALLLVDGSPGGFEAGFEGGGQTCEHAQLARSLGVEQVAVVVSKLDLADHSRERYEGIKATLGPYLRSTCGFKDSQLQWLPAVGPAGQNLTGPPSEPGLSWWKGGPCLVQAIDNFSPRERLISKPLRLVVAEVSRGGGGARTGGGGGSGSVSVSGKVEAGAVKVGGKVVVVPGGEVATVKSIEVDGQSVSLARAGSSAELVVSGLSEAVAGGLGVGSVLCHPDYPVPTVTKFEARVVVLDIPVPLLKGAACALHAHVSSCEARIETLTALLDPRTGEVTKARPRCLTKGVTAVVEVAVAGKRSVCCEEYGDLRPLGRIALRDGGRTLAVGVINRLLA